MIVEHKIAKQIDVSELQNTDEKSNTTSTSIEELTTNIELIDDNLTTGPVVL